MLRMQDAQLRRVRLNSLSGGGVSTRTVILRVWKWNYDCSPNAAISWAYAESNSRASTSRESSFA